MKFGAQKIYLPKFTIAMLRTEGLAPNYAHFQVPLNITKLDMKDYLYHLYNTEVVSIRSYVLGVPRSPKHIRGPVELNKRFKKRMIVELKSPFVYPEEIKDKTPWDSELYDAAYENEKAKYKLDFSRGRELDEGRRSKIIDAAKEVLVQKGLKKTVAKAPMK
ncbi:hypothetical protein BJ508DRAFT_357569 [Ascobolus immersus RN42]|uniref:Large ribosomal subunit protein uL23m n=1 Tax=Ascobolus immersus RN42 TaxID=1160509 RepID=A0A3N4IQU3_ASCIM|nr:hypothetical protein BJ508DRAFT_357569 [Ascobolus immersus RN42]